MSTRSAIIVKHGDGYRGIYCHFDGYPDGVGKILSKHYTIQEKVDSLIALGDLSSLGTEVSAPEGKTHSYDKPIENVTVAYARDRGDTGCEPKDGATVKAVRDKIEHQYAYVFTGAAWRCLEA